jgi:competence protein ComGC
MKKTTVVTLCAAMLMGTALLLTVLPTFARDAATADAVKVDDSSKMIYTPVKSYEQKTNTRHSLRSAANQMQQAARKDRTQTAPEKAASTAPEKAAQATPEKAARTVSTTKISHKSRQTHHL